MATSDESIVFLFDRRVSQIESGLDEISSHMKNQSETIQQMSNALTAVVRLEERLTASIENTREQRQSLQRVHDRLDQTLSVMAESAKNFRDLVDAQTEECNARIRELAARNEEKIREMFRLIEEERAACALRSDPIVAALNQHKGALRLITFIFPTITTVMIGIVSFLYSQQSAELKELSKWATRHETADASANSQLVQMRKELDSLQAGK